MCTLKEFGNTQTPIKVTRKEAQEDNFGVARLSNLN